MPSNSNFGFSILVSDKELPEYTHPEDSRRVMVESVLVSPLTYWTKSSTYSSFSQEIEEQKWPVTPYKVKVSAKPHCPYSLFWVFVDGVKANYAYVTGGESIVFDGFADSKLKEEGASREFLFSLPRFAEDENDRVKSERSGFIGKIEVSRHDAVHMDNPRHAQIFTIDFTQANKKDVNNVTKQEYTMATTRQGKLIRNGKPYDRPSASRGTDSNPYPPLAYIQVYGEVSRLPLEYHMTHTLLDWGINLVQIDWTN